MILSRSAGSTLASPGLTRVAAPCGLGSVRTQGGPSPLRVASHPPEHSGSYCCDGRRVPRRECGGGQQARGPPDAVATLLPHSVGPSEVPRPAVSSCAGRPACPLEKRTGLVTLGHTHRTQAHAGTHKSTRAERDSQATEAGPWAPARPGDAAAEAARLCVAAVTQTQKLRGRAWPRWGCVCRCPPSPDVALVTMFPRSNQRLGFPRHSGAPAGWLSAPRLCAGSSGSLRSASPRCLQ